MKVHHLACQVWSETVRANANRSLCIHYNNLIHLKFIETCSVRKIKACNSQQWICHNSHLKELPFLTSVTY